ncbi:MAG: hypothetical protein AAGF32_02895, partial [Pseudomonadota bacterium]
KAWRTRYPNLLTLAAQTPAAPLGNRAFNNVFAGMTPYYVTPAAEPFRGGLASARPRSAPAARGPTATQQRLRALAGAFAGHALLGPALATARRCSDITLPVAGVR